MAATAAPRLLDPGSTAAVLLGASDWTEAGLGRAPSFRRSAKGVLSCLIGDGGLGLDPELVLDLFDDPGSAAEQLARVRDTLDALLRERREAGRPVADLLLYYVGHGSTDEQGHLALLVRRSRAGLEAETGIKAPDLARVLRVAAPQQRRLVVLDCCFAEAAARSFIGMGGALDQAVAATAGRDIAEALPSRGGVLLCSSPIGEISVGPPNAERTLFTGAVLDVLRGGAEGCPPLLSFADLRDAAYDRMLESFGARAPRPVLHPVNQAQGDLSRLPAFPNRAMAKVAEAPVPDPPAARSSNSPAASPPPRSLPPAERSPPASWLQESPEQSLRPTPAKAEEALHAKSSPRTASPSPTLGAGPSLKATTPHGACEERQQISTGKLVIGSILALLALLGVVLAFAETRPISISIPPPQATGRPTQTAEPARQPPPATPLPQVASRPPQASSATLFANGQAYAASNNLKEAAILYRLAADEGHAAAQFNLGLLYALGQGGLPRDEREALRLYRLAADKGYAAAQANLGTFYEGGLGGLQRDTNEAVRLYRLAARAGNTLAQQRLTALRESW